MSEPYRWYDDTADQLRAAASGGGGGGDALPIADPTGVTIETAPNTVTGSGDYEVLTVPAETPVLAVKLAGDNFPRLVISADPTDYGALFLGDGTSDPLAGNPAIAIDGAGYLALAGQTGVHIANLRATSAGTRLSSDLTFDHALGPVIQSPNGTQYRIKVADDGTMSTEAV